MEPRKRDYWFYVEDKTRMGRMNDPSVAAMVNGVCGDTQELYLVIGRDQLIEQALYFATGCEATHACGAYVAEWVEGVTIAEALSLSASKIIKALKDIPEDHHHCAVLVMMALYKALGEYMITPKY